MLDYAFQIEEYGADENKLHVGLTLRHAILKPDPTRLSRLQVFGRWLVQINAETTR